MDYQSTVLAQQATQQYQQTQAWIATSSVLDAATPLPANPSATISYPHDGDSVGWKVQVSGSSTGLRPDQRAFLCIQSQHFGRLIWPQGEIFPGANNQWNVEGTYQSVGYPYDTYVVVTSNPASAEMLADNYYRANGMDSLPVGTTIISPVYVFMRE